jgi:hypothetical protein
MDFLPFPQEHRLRARTGTRTFPGLGRGGGDWATTSHATWTDGPWQTYWLGLWRSRPSTSLTRPLSRVAQPLRARRRPVQRRVSARRGQLAGTPVAGHCRYRSAWSADLPAPAEVVGARDPGRARTTNSTRTAPVPGPHARLDSSRVARRVQLPVEPVPRSHWCQLPARAAGRVCRCRCRQDNSDGPHLGDVSLMKELPVAKISGDVEALLSLDSSARVVLPCRDPRLASRKGHA